MAPCQREWNFLPGFDYEVSSRLKIFTAQRNWSGKYNPIWASYCAQHAFRRAADPWNHCAVLEPDDQFRSHLNAAADTAHQSQDILVLAPAVHAIHQNDGSLWS